ncbi:hypothetical protein [uncultured Tateyamaria sp.]|uniref:CBU_0592 family membrane protein n=1 Tax=uncultured Tateyamaria sp. TaxID=455651 RepID=UPI0026280D8F|nr:hypothetical protein [uncultured Tateyamaria sp.]
MPIFDSVPVAVLNAIGLFGFALYILNYSLLTLHWRTSSCATYFAINLVAASCVLIGLAASFNLAAALIQIFWVIMSSVGLVMRLRRGVSRVA